MSPEPPHRRRLRAHGFRALCIWATLGLGLELAHALKLPGLLDDSLRRELLRWGHAHGVGLSLIVLVYAAAGGRTEQGPSAGTGRLLLAAAWLLPLGFVLGGLHHYESDPGPGIALSPVGGLLLLWGLWRATREVRPE